MDECDGDTHDCDENAVCQNTAGSYTCECNQHYVGDGRTCDLDECSAGTHICDENASCQYAPPGDYTCECNPGYQGDGFSCDPDIDTYVLDISDRPVYILMTDFGAFDIHAMSRVGWDIEVIETDIGGGLTHKDPGLILYPHITMRNLRGPHYALEYLAAWMGAADPTPQTITMTLVGLGGEEMVLELYNVRPVGGDPTLTPEDGYWSIMSELIVEFGPDAIPGRYVGVGVPSYTYPQGGNYPVCALPGHQLEIEGWQVTSCWPLDTVELPPEDTSEPIYLPNNRDGGTLFDWMEQTTDEWVRAAVVSRRCMSVIERDPRDNEIYRMNFFEAWPERIHLFNPLKPYGYSNLVDVLVTNDWNEPRP